MQSKLFEQESNILHQIAEASEAIRTKHKKIKLGKDTAERLISDALAPVVTPLVKLVDQTAPQQHYDIKKKKKNYKENHTLSRFNQKDETGFYKTAIEDDQDDDNYYQDNAGSTQTVTTSTPFSPKLRTPYGSPAELLDDSYQDLAVAATSPKDSTNIIHKYLNKLRTKHADDLDTEFGVRHLKEGLKIGDSIVAFHGNSMMLKNQTYSLTPGLIELIFKKKPSLQSVTTDDKTTYSRILDVTYACQKHYKANSSPRTSSIPKYKNIIQPSLESSISKIGSSLLPEHMIASTRRRKMEYVYWDNPNELVERLHLLTASQNAGNDSHTNEIISIIEELREAGIIY